MRPPIKVGFFCFKCGRDDFGNNQKSLSAHVRYCATTAKKKSNNQSSGTLHSSGTSPFPFLTKRSRNQYEDSFEFADQPTCDDDHTLNVDYLHQPTEIEITDTQPFEFMSNHSSNLPPLEDIEITQPPYNKDCSFPPSYQFQLDLLSTLSKHKIDLNLHDEIIDVIKQHSSETRLHFSSDTLQNRLPLLKKIERNLDTNQLKPIDHIINLSGGAQATISVFNLKAMILSLLLDDNLMTPENLAQGYDIFTGTSSQPDDVYGEIHTGDAWEPARRRFCGDDPRNMPVALVVFGDKSHFDLHGTLSTLPLTFTLSCFNLKSRNSSEFWRPLAFIPNLSYGATSSKNSAKPVESLQDEHECLKACFQELIDIHRSGGIPATVMGRPVILKVWIHFFVGDTSGNNRWLGHFNGSGMLTCPYRDCRCSFEDMDNVFPQCEYVTCEDYYRMKNIRSTLKSNAARLEHDRSWSKHNIDNAFMNPYLPLSDQIHGIFRMTPPERLHTTQEGLTKYMIDNLRVTIGDTGERKKLVSDIENVHHHLHYDLKRNSERDLPRGSVRNSVLKNSLVTASERRGNLFRFLCLAHTDQIKARLKQCFSNENIRIADFFLCLKLYLGMENWFHASNPKTEVRSSKILIAQTLQLIKDVFPRTDTNGEEVGQGWSIPKFHGTTKFTDYIILFGSAINFFGGVGECNHKTFVKATGHNTQKRIDSFTSQVATRYYEAMTIGIAKNSLDKRRNDEYEYIGGQKRSTNKKQSWKENIFSPLMD